MALHGLEELPDLQINDAIAQHEWRHALQLIEKREKKSKSQSSDWLVVPAASHSVVAAMAYMKHFPSKRDPFFWAIFANFMASQNPHSPEQERHLCGAMAYRMCAKAAEDVCLDSDKVKITSHSCDVYDHRTEREKALKNGRAPRTPGELAFLLDVYESQGKRREALAVLESRKTSVLSIVESRSWDLALRKIQLFEHLGCWLEQFEYCSALLEGAIPNSNSPPIQGFGEIGNNWSVWVATLRSVTNLQDCKINTKDL
ncbi:MAG: hypothetical protein Q9219_000071 [cf. Caloplaca sp. 3 TL-2023]